MKHTAISLAILLLLLPLVSSFDFSFVSPPEVIQEEEFSISISSESTSDLYDVKVYVNDASREFSEIYDGEEWKSPYYYLISVYPETKEYRVKSHFIGETNICIKLRKTGSSSATQVCNPIRINPAVPSEEDNLDSAVESEDMAEEPSYDEIILETTSSEQNLEEFSPPKYNTEKIVLNPIKEEVSFFMSKEEKIRLSMIYAFSFLCIIIIALLLLKKL